MLLNPLPAAPFPPRFDALLSPLPASSRSEVEKAGRGGGGAGTEDSVQRQDDRKGELGGA
eukprot:1639673-Rhodomonas_salina.1